MSSARPSLETETIQPLLSSGVRRAVLAALESMEPATPEELGSRLASSDHDLGRLLPAMWTSERSPSHWVTATFRNSTRTTSSTTAIPGRT